MSQSICRLCLGKVKLLSVFDKRLYCNMCDIIYTSCGVKISTTDEVTQMVCVQCCLITIRMFKFKIKSLKNDRTLQLRHQNIIKADASSKTLVDLTQTLDEEDSTMHPSLMELKETYPKMTFADDYKTFNFNCQLVVNSDEVKDWFDKRKRMDSDTCSEYSNSSKRARLSTTSSPLLASDYIDPLTPFLSSDDPDLLYDRNQKDGEIIEIDNYEIDGAEATEENGNSGILQKLLLHLPDKSSDLQAIGWEVTQTSTFTPKKSRNKKNYNRIICYSTDSEDETLTSESVDNAPESGTPTFLENNVDLIEASSEALSQMNEKIIESVQIDGGPKTDFLETLKLIPNATGAPPPVIPDSPLTAAVHKVQNLYTCTICDSVHTNIKELHNHQRSIHTRCVFCNSRFKTLAAKEKHLNHCDKNPSRPRIKPKPCSIVLTRVDEIPEIRNRYRSAFEPPEMTSVYIQHNDHTYNNCIENAIEREETSVRETVIDKAPPEKTVIPTNKQQTKNDSLGVICISDEEDNNGPFTPKIKIKNGIKLSNIDVKQTDVNIIKDILKQVNQNKLNILNYNTDDPLLNCRTEEDVTNTFKILQGSNTKIKGQKVLQNLRKCLNKYKIPVEILYGNTLNVTYKANVVETEITDPVLWNVDRKKDLQSLITLNSLLKPSTGIHTSTLQKNSYTINNNRPLVATISNTTTPFVNNPSVTNSTMPPLVSLSNTAVNTPLLQTTTPNSTIIPGTPINLQFHPTSNVANNTVNYYVVPTNMLTTAPSTTPSTNQTTVPVTSVPTTQNSRLLSLLNHQQLPLSYNTNLVSMPVYTQTPNITPAVTAPQQNFSGPTIINQNFTEVPPQQTLPPSSSSSSSAAAAAATQLNSVTTSKNSFKKLIVIKPPTNMPNGPVMRIENRNTEQNVPLSATVMGNGIRVKSITELV